MQPKGTPQKQLALDLPGEKLDAAALANLIREADELLKNEQFQEAEEILKRVLATDPTRTKALELLSERYARRDAAGRSGRCLILSGMNPGFRPLGITILELPPVNTATSITSSPTLTGSCKRLRERSISGSSASALTV